MDEQAYKDFEAMRLVGTPIREIASTYNHGHNYYQRHGYVDRFIQEHPDFPETRGRGYHKQPRAYADMDEVEYEAFVDKRLAGQSIDDIVYKSSHAKNYFYTTGIVARFNHEYPKHKAKQSVHKSYSNLDNDQIYNDYIEYHRQGMALADIATQLNVPISRIKQVITGRESRELIQYADDTLAKAVKQAKRHDKFKIIDDFRQELIADYGKTLMDVPNDEPRLLALQLANQTLT